MQFQIINHSKQSSIRIEKISEANQIAYYQVGVDYPSDQIPESFRVEFSIPALDVYSTWSPAQRFNKCLGPNWGKRDTPSRLASWMPLHALVSADGRNKITIALSDALNPTTIASGICEEDATVQFEIQFFTGKVAPLRSYCAIIRIDTRDIPYYDALTDASLWWETDCGYTPAFVPEHAKLPMNSLWYSYHQKLDPEDILKECVLSKELGMDTVIIDDGWQTDDNNRGYKFCGDWEVEPKKIPDMKRFVDQIHATGMKAMLWFSVPYIGVGAKNFERFKDMLLDETGDRSDFFSFDPRYKEVRDHLIGIYERAIRDWGLDGLKLDFIDSFELRGKSLAFDPRRDYQSLEDAVDRLMTDVCASLQAINPDVLIEFRQSYVGPAIRKYGNMLRVGDCPADAIRNRQNIVALRMTSGNTAVHSDMLMWNTDDSVESAAVQVASVLFSVPQISVKIETLPQEHRKMLAYYLSFWRKYRSVLLDGKLRAYNPESAYSMVSAEQDGKAIFVSYTDTVADCKDLDEAIVVNCSHHSTVILKNAAGKAYETVDCMGSTLHSGVVDCTLFEVEVPLCGMVFVK